jgi:hypothetical protein
MRKEIQIITYVYNIHIEVLAINAHRNHPNQTNQRFRQLIIRRHPLTFTIITLHQINGHGNKSSS